MPGREIDGIRTRFGAVRVVNEHGGDRVEPDARQWSLRSSVAPISELYTWSARMTGRPISVEFGFPPRRVFLDSALEVRVTAEEVSAGDLQPRVDVHLALGPMVILKERGVTVVK